MTAVPSWSTISFSPIKDSRGALIAIEELSKNCPFSIKRLYYLYNVSSGAQRGGHAHKNLQQLLIPIAGAFKLHLDNGYKKEIIDMRRSDQGLLIFPGTWREISEFSYGSVCLCLASEQFNEDDYIRDYNEFREWLQNSHSTN